MRFSRLRSTKTAVFAIILMIVSASTLANAASYLVTFLTADQSGIATHTDGAFLHTQSFPGAEVRAQFLPTAHRRRGQESVLPELPGIAGHAV